MTHAHFRRIASVSLVVAVAVCLVGCKPKFEGKYVGAANMLTIEFKSGKATLTDGSAPPEVDDYTIDGDKITVKAKSGDIPFTLMQDGTLAAPWPIGSLQKSAD
jgi:hypothetical protein